MPRKSITSTAIISIATVLVVFVVAIGLILINNYQKNKNTPPASPLASQLIEVKARLTNPSGIDHPYVIDSASALKQDLKISTLKGFDPQTQVLVGLTTTAKSNTGYGAALEKTTSQNNRVNIDYKITQPDPDQVYADVITYPQLWVTIDRTDLPAYSPLNFVFTNLTDGATQTIAKELGVQ